MQVAKGLALDYVVDEDRAAAAGGPRPFDAPLRALQKSAHAHAHMRTRTHTHTHTRSRTHTLTHARAH